MPTNESQYADLVKSVSKFVIKEKHQTTNKGDVYEQDIFTIDGRTLYDKNKKTVYKSGNFIITASNEQVAPMPPSDIVWETPPNSDCVEWTWEDVEDVNEEDDTSVSLELKPDIFDLRTFAYYGSCSELIRASLNHIISTFPGEVYASSQKLVYLDKSGATEQYSELGDGTFKNIVDNPFGLNLHEKDVESYFIDKDPLKYLLPDDFYKTAYIFIDENDNEYEITSITYTPVNKPCFAPYDKLGEITIAYSGGSKTVHVWKLKGRDYAYLTNGTGWHIRPKEEYRIDFRRNLSLFEKVLLSEETLPKYSPYFEILTETDYGFSSQMQQFSFPIDPYGKYNLDVNSMAYTTYSSSLSTIGERYDELFCDNLYRSMTHEAITNFDWSFQKEKNESIESQNREGGTVMQKILRLIAREFDDIKLYIEGIKDANKLTYNGKGNVPDYLLTDCVENEGWDYKHIIPFVKKELYKLTKGTETEYSWLEESELDSDNLKDFNKEIVNDTFKETETPIYSFPESTEPVTPYYFDPETDDCDNACDFIEKIQTYTSKVEYTPKDVNNHFTKLLALNSKAIWRRKGTIEAIESLLSLFGLKSRDWVEDLIKERNNFDPTKSSVNGEVNCPDRENYSTIGNDYDYEIIEYSYKDIKGVFAEDESKYSSDDYLGTLDERKLWLDVNENKYIGYEEDSILETPHTDWRGLLLKEKTYFQRDDDNNLQKDTDGNPIVDHYTLYPWFDKNTENDGNPYYQMYGGWMKRTNSLGELTQSYELEDGTLKTNVTDDLVTIPYYTESIAKIRGVETLKELMSLNKSILNDGDICYVSDLSRSFIVIDGIPYELNKYKVKQKNEKNEWVYEWVENWYYIDATVKNKSIILGTKIYRDSLHTVEPVLEDGKPVFKDDGTPVISNKIKPLKQYSDGAIVKILINETIKFMPSDNYGTITNNTIFITPEKLGFAFTEEEELCCKSVKCSEGYGERIGDESELGTHYFMLTNVKYSNYLNMSNDSTVSNHLGWNQLSEDSPEYKHIKSIKNNYSGNNPHTHKVESDSGETYIQHFANLFKYSTDNNLIDWNTLYTNYGKDTYSEQSKFMKDVKSFGFKKLIKDNDICAVNPPTEDIKVWNARSEDRDPEGNYLLNLGEDNFVDSDSIMNTKLVKIKFQCTPELTDKFKYINDVVLHYLEQVLPSTIIVKIEYA